MGRPAAVPVSSATPRKRKRVEEEIEGGGEVEGSRGGV